MLKTRDDFRISVFNRDRNLCVICKSLGQDAHHILERRLFPDGGYYLDNGATLCRVCHILAEKTLLSCEEIRDSCGIRSVILPPHLYRDQKYDKWGNPILDNGRRLRGELFEDESVQKILAEVLHLFTDRVKYPRTWHIPSSPGATKDDRIMASLENFNSKSVVITEKMDGENTSLYQDYVHARSIDYNPHPSRGWIRAFHAKICNDIPKGWRICGENVYAKHSLGYDGLESYFLGFSIWNEKNECLSWPDTMEWFDLIGIRSVPIIYQGLFSNSIIEDIVENLDTNKHEGFVLRVMDKFHARDFSKCVGKYVRENHVQTHGHWLRQAITQNTLKETNELLLQ